MLDTRGVHLDPTSQMFDLRHNVEVPINVPDGTRRLGVTPVVLKELLTIPQSGIVISNDFQQGVPVTT